jgi:hypothetical protein
LNKKRQFFVTNIFTIDPRIRYRAQGSILWLFSFPAKMSATIVSVLTKNLQIGSQNNIRTLFFKNIVNIFAERWSKSAKVW